MEVGIIEKSVPVFEVENAMYSAGLKAKVIFWHISMHIPELR